MHRENFSLIAIGLKRSHCELLANESTAQKGQMNISVNIEGQEPMSSETDKYDLIVAIELKVEGLNENNDKVFSCETQHHGGFKLKQEMEIDVTDEIQAIELSDQLIPIITSHQTDLLNKMGLKNVRLPWSFEITPTEHAEPST